MHRSGRARPRRCRSSPDLPASLEADGDYDVELLLENMAAAGLQTALVSVAQKYGKAAIIREFLLSLKTAGENAAYDFMLGGAQAAAQGGERRGPSTSLAVAVRHRDFSPSATTT